MNFYTILLEKFEVKLHVERIVRIDFGPRSHGLNSTRIRAVPDPATQDEETYCF